MIGREVVAVTVIKPFSLRERFRVMFGRQLILEAHVEITATYVAKRREVKIQSTMKEVKAFYGIQTSQAPSKSTDQAQPV